MFEYEHRDAIGQVDLVGELDLEALGPGAEESLRDAAEGSSRSLARLYRIRPVSLVIYLCAQAADRYRAGTFWPNLSIEDLRDNMLVGPQFLKALDELGLRRFDEIVEQGGLHYVSPILAHTGVPAYCAHDLVRILRGFLREGAFDATDVLARLRADEWRMRELDRPVQRFLEYGQSVAVRVVDRMVRLLRREVEPEESGLPGYLIEAIVNEPPVRVRPQQQRIAAPRVRIDPASGTGPLVELPITESKVGCTHWLLKNPGRVDRDASPAEQQTVQLNPAAQWTVTAMNGTDAVRSYEFLTPGRAHVWLFDMSGRLLGDQQSLTVPSLYVLLGPEVELTAEPEGAIRVLEDDFPLAPPWQGYTLRCVDVRSAHRLRVTDTRRRESAARALIRVQATEKPPRLLVERVPLATDEAGRQVIASPPRLDPGNLLGVAEDWTVELATPDGSVRRRGLSDFPIAHELELEGLLAPDEAIAARYSLKSAERTITLGEYMHVPGLCHDAKPATVRPDSSFGVRLSRQLGDSKSEIGILTFGPGEYRQPFDVQTEGGTTVSLTFELPRLLWQLSPDSADHFTFGNARHHLTADDLTRHPESTLHVHALPDAVVELDVRNGREVLQGDQWSELDANGVAHLPLAPLLDTIRSANSRTLSIRLRVRHTYADVATIHTQFRASNVLAGLGPTDDDKLEISWTEDYRFPQRAVVLWSLDDLDAGPIVHQIPDSDDTDAVVPLSNKPPGMYAVDVDRVDPWISPVRGQRQFLDRPRLFVTEAEGCWVVTSPDERMTRLLRGETDVMISEEEVDLLRGPLVAALADCRHTAGCQARYDPVASRVIGLLFEQPLQTLEALSHAAEDGIVSKDTARWLSVLLLPDVLDCLDTPPEEHLLDRLWPHFPALAAACETNLGDDSRRRWSIHTGWSPPTASPILRFGNEPPEEIWIGKAPSERTVQRALSSISRPSDRELRTWTVAPLMGRAYSASLYDWLTSRDVVGLSEDWCERYEVLTDHRCTTGKPWHEMLQALKRDKRRPRWQSLPQIALAAAIHIVNWGDSALASRALLELVEFAPALTIRSCLLAVIADRFK